MASQNQTVNPRDRFEPSGDPRAPGQRLFQRTKSATVTSMGGDRYRVEVTLVDTFHELWVEMEVDEDSHLAAVRGGFLRAPYRLCQATEKALPQLANATVSRGIGREIRQALDGPDGCAHLADAVLEGVKAAIQAGFILEGAGLSRSKRIDAYKKRWAGSCHAYSRL